MKSIRERHGGSAIPSGARMIILEETVDELIQEVKRLTTELTTLKERYEKHGQYGHETVGSQHHLYSHEK